MPTIQKRAPVALVYVNGNLNPDARALSVTLGSSAQSLPEATLEIETIGRKPGRVELLGVNLTTLDQPEIEIVVKTGNREQVVHWGKANARHVTLNEGGDNIRVISRVEDHHFGRPLRYAFFWDSALETFTGLDLPTIFNPEDADGVVQNNRSAKTDQKTGSALFIHPESARTEAAREYADSPEVKAWTLPEAVYYVCTILNNETHIKNPTLRDLKAILPADPSLLRNHELKIGEFLPSQLDTLLTPFGFGWTVEFLGRGSRRIRIFSRNTGTPIDLKLQAPGESIDLDKSQLESLALTSDVSSGAFNRLTVLGDYKRFESTFELKRAWSAEHDGRSMDDLTLDNEDWKETPELERVWRDWVLNEAGDYIGVRDGYDKPYDFNSLFGQGEWVARRRKFEPCLTTHHDGSPKGHAFGVYVEYWNESQDEWLPVTSLGSESNHVVVLERECGIRFNGPEIPYEIRTQGENAKVRVTAVVRSDTRVEAFKDSGASLLAETNDSLIVAGGRFKYEKRDGTSILAGFSADTSDSKKFSHDDSKLIESLTAKLLDRWNVATIGGSVTMTGIDYHSYSLLIGTTIGGISGRKVSFNVSPGVARYPTVIGARIDFQSQQLDLALDTFRGERAI